MLTDPASLSPDELAECARVLNVLAAAPACFFDRKDEHLGVRAAANRVVEAIQRESAARREEKSATESQAALSKRKAHDSSIIARTGMRQMRAEVPALPAPTNEPLDAVRLIKSRHCYVCKVQYTQVHSYYDSLCIPCAELNFAKRMQTTDLTGKTALVTGARIKIGFEIALKLLRAGARVVATTRFPFDAAGRYAREPDFHEWRHRLQIHAIDLRDVRTVDRLADALANELGSLDILINNAAQTVRRPSEYYRHLVDEELAGPKLLPAEASGLVTTLAFHNSDRGIKPAALTQVPLLLEDLGTDAANFPPGARDRFGQQIDKRDFNSWVQEVGEIATNEVLETHYVNAIAPFILVNRLLPLVERSPGDKFIVNVSAMEGKFDYPMKLSAHPHTNMAKASLNMLTRTVAASLAEKRVFMNSVDTGWVTNENPFPKTERMRSELQFEPPLDEIDGAARVLDPIFSAGEEPLFGLFLKDYRSAGW